MGSSKERLQTQRLFPSPRLTESRATPLSILDATVARFDSAGAVWIFEKGTKGRPVESLVEQLRTTFVTTLSSFPHWAGQLQWAPVREGGGHNERFNRPMVVYGADSDPGVDWTVVSHDCAVASVAPPASERISGKGIWMATDFPQEMLLSKTSLALFNLQDYAGLPGMAVQVNTFTCGGYAIGVKMAHPLADAQSLAVFMHQWAATSRKLLGRTGKSMMGYPVFNPAQLDACATGGIDSATPDPKICASARSLPLHRYDWWSTSAPGYPQMLLPTTEASKPSAEQLSRTVISPSTPCPWNTWRLEKPVSHAQIHFSEAELGNLRASARNDTDARQDISRLDCLLSHLWGLINRARGHSESDETVYLDVTLGARPRVSPSLPESFLGSPIFLTHVQAPGSTASTASIGQTATSLRNTFSKFTPDKIGDMLHDAAHEASPQRLWQTFLGSQHTLVTSWMRLRVYDIDFEGEGKTPRYVQAAMPKVDGCLQVMDTSEADGGGIDVSLYLEAEAMERLVDDGQLRAYVDK